MVSSLCLVNEVLSIGLMVGRVNSPLVSELRLKPHFVAKRMRRAESPDAIEKEHRTGLVFVSCRLGISGRQHLAQTFT